MIHGTRMEAALTAVARTAGATELWSNAMALVAESAGAHIGTLLPVDPFGRKIVSASGAGLIEEYDREKWGFNNPRIARAMRSPVAARLRAAIDTPHIAPFTSQFVSEAELFPQGEFAGTPFYEDYLARHGLRWSCGAPLLTVTGGIVFLALERRTDQGPFQPGELAKLQRLIAPLQTAVSLAAVAALAESQGLLGAYDSMELAAYLIDGRGEVSAMNKSGERLAEATNLLKGRKFCASLPEDQKGVDRLIGQAGAAIYPPNLGSSAAIVRRETGLPVILHALPLPRRYMDAFIEARAIIIAIDPERRRLPSELSMSELLGFTAAEARIANGLAAGKPVEALAQEYNVSPHTVRSQVKSILSKTGLRRQADLISLIGNLAGPRSKQ